MKLITTAKQHIQPLKFFFLCLDFSLHRLLSRFHTSFRLGHAVYSHDNGKPVKYATQALQPETGECKPPKGCHYWPSPNFLIITPAEDYKWLNVGGLFYHDTRKKRKKRNYTQGCNTCIIILFIKNWRRHPWNPHLSLTDHITNKKHSESANLSRGSSPQII